MAEEGPVSSLTSANDEHAISESSTGEEDEKFLARGAKDENDRNGIGRTKSMMRERLASVNLQFIFWTGINTLATIAIVFTNKQIFRDPHLRKTQSTFAAFHFAVTGLTLYYASRKSVALFQPQRASLVPMIPLGLAMSMNVILPNLSLAYSSITLYQVARILLTPTVAVIHFAVYGVRLPKQAGYCLIPICLGVAMVSYYDTMPRQGVHGRGGETSLAGIIFALSGVLASSMYTVWIEIYRKRFELNSMQLLFNQAPISAFLLLYVIPYTDQMPDWSRVALSKWMLILFSGLMAALLNISQFFIVAGAGPVSSTVVGHLKTCSIVALGWGTGRRSTSDRGVFGIFMALTGIVMYSVVTYQHMQRRIGNQMEQLDPESQVTTEKS